jgi:acyl-CoA reductase-like NAD-dependent aldehyde dehydrogenase
MHTPVLKALSFRSRPSTVTTSVASLWPRSDGNYFTNTSPVNGKPIAEFPRSTAKDIDKALDAAHAAADAWGKTSAQDRSLVLLKIADRIEQNLELLAITETWDNGKAVRETLNADIPLAADHFRYFAGCIRAQEGSAPRSTNTPPPITSMSPWVWSGRSSRGTSRC